MVSEISLKKGGKNLFLTLTHCLLQICIIHALLLCIPSALSHCHLPLSSHLHSPLHKISRTHSLIHSRTYSLILTHAAEKGLHLVAAPRFPLPAVSVHTITSRDGCKGVVLGAFRRLSFCRLPASWSNFCQPNREMFFFAQLLQFETEMDVLLSCMTYGYMLQLPSHSNMSGKH